MPDIPLSPSPTPPESAPPPKTEKPEYKPKGKIAWLPKSVRDRINLMLAEGATYAAIVKELAHEAPGLNISNLFRHHKNGFRHWLQEQHWLADTCSRQESAIEFSRKSDAANLNHAAVQVALTQIYDAHL